MIDTTTSKERQGCLLNTNSNSKLEEIPTQDKKGGERNLKIYGNSMIGTYQILFRPNLNVDTTLAVNNIA